MLNIKTERIKAMKNIFNNSYFYLEQLKNIYVAPVYRRVLDGKSLTTVWLAKFCSTNCQYCSSKSNMHKDSDIIEKYQFSDYGIERLIEFIGDSNNSYVMMSGSGEPMIHKKTVNAIVQYEKTDRIVIVTNGI